VLEKIVGARSKVKILREMVAAEEREYCLEDLVKATGQSFGTVHPALKDLLDSRIVIVRKMGRSKLYKVNTRHVLFNRIKELLQEEEKGIMAIAEEFVDRLNKTRIKNVVLFGSAARGDFGERSDIDLLIIFSRKKPEDDVEKVLRELLDKYDVDIVPTYLSMGEVRNRLKGTDRFILNVVNEGKLLYGDDKWLEK
jgi:predicted nucleotidyltransferase